jgi:hypothetical protein
MTQFDLLTEIVKYKEGVNNWEQLITAVEAYSSSHEQDAVKDFAFRMAKALKDSKNSSAIFFMQQAFPDDVDGLDQQSFDDILDNIIILSQPKNR